MKKILSLVTVFVTLALTMTASAAPFTDGNIVVYRVGDGVNTLTNSGSPVFLDEYTTNGGFVQSIMLRTNYFGAYSPLIGSGTAFGSGLITRSVDGRFILVNGYGANLNQITTSLGTSFASSIPRVTGLVDGQGNQDTTTTRTNTDFDSVELRSAASDDGTNIWTAGDGGGIQYGTRGSTDSTSVETAQGNVRQINIFGSQLYFDINNPSGLTQSVALCTNNIPNDLPKNTNNVATGFLPGVTADAPEAFLGLKLKAGGAAAVDTLYVANSSVGNIIKYSLVGSSWVNNGSISGIAGALGLAGKTRIVGNTTNVDLFISQGGATLTGGDNIARVTDVTGYNANPAGGVNLALIVFGSVNKALRGIAISPTNSSELALPQGAGRLSVGPAIDVFAKTFAGCVNVTETDVYSLANIGNSSINWTANVDSNWVSISPTSGTLGSLASANVTVTLNGNVTSLTAPTNTAVISFVNTTSGLGNTTRKVFNFLDQQQITPVSDYSISGPPSSGPFTPSNKVYTVTTGPAITLNVSKDNASTWLNIGTNVGSTNISLSACSSTIVTVSVNQAVANGLAADDYVDTIIFSNATAGTVIDTRNVLLQVGFRYFCDVFSAAGGYEQNAILAGQNGWIAFGGSLNEPMVTNNAIYVTTTTTQQAADEPIRNFPQLTASNNPTASMYCSMSIMVTSAAPVGTVSPSRIWTFAQNNGFGGFARDSLTVRDTGTGTFVFGIRVNGIGANTNVFGTTAYNYNTTNTIIIQGKADNTNSYVYVNPVSSTLDTNTADVRMRLVSGSDFNVGSVQIGNAFNSASFNYQAGIAIFKMCVTTNAADAYNMTITIPPTPTNSYAAWLTQYGLSGGNALGSADPDGDGMINTNEFLAGFNPTNSAAYPHIILITNSGPNTVITYLGASGDTAGSPGPKTNVLEFTTGTGNGSYSNNFVSTGLTNVLTGGTGLGTSVTVTDLGAAASTPARYYRVRVLLP